MHGVCQQDYLDWNSFDMFFDFFGSFFQSAGRDGEVKRDRVAGWNAKTTLNFRTKLKGHFHGFAHARALMTVIVS